MLNMNMKFSFVMLSVVSLVLCTAGDSSSPTAGKFATELIATVATESSAQNVVFSPLLTEAALTLLYYGAAGTTAEALRQTLHLQSLTDKEAAMRNAAELLGVFKSTPNTSTCLANALYVRDRLAFDFKADFRQLAAQHFGTPTERINFGKASHAAEKINYWFLTQTNFTTGEVLNARNIDASTELLLANAINFKAPWARGFDVKMTERLNFHTDLKSHALVESMFVSHSFRFGELKELQAKAIELPYLQSDLKMLLLLPDQVDGLQALQQKLKGMDLADISGQLSERKVALTLPKFSIETSIDLKPALMQLGLSNIFTSAANFQNMFSTLFSSKSPCFVSRVQHKALLEVDEAGEMSEQGFSLGNIFRRSTQMVVSHPFVFAVMNEKAVLLAGHVVRV